MCDIDSVGLPIVPRRRMQ